MKKSSFQLKKQIDLVLMANNSSIQYLKYFIENNNLSFDDKVNFENIYQHLENLNKFFLQIQRRL